MRRYICSDLHLGHSGIQRFRRDFRSAEDHHNFVWANLEALDGKRVMFFLLGDVAFTPEWLQKIKDLRAQKVLILGNHDLDRSVKNMSDLVEAYDDIYSLHKYKGYWLSHAPIHPDELRGKKNIHGHTHPYLMKDGEEVDPRYINVCMEYTGYKPISWEEATSKSYLTHCENLYKSTWNV